MTANRTYLHFWGKARGAREGEPETHPAAYHGLDVAAAADALLGAHERALSRIAALLDTTADNARRTIVALIALHDVGKFADAFQAQVPDAWPKAILGPLPEHPQSRHHTVVAMDLFEGLNLGELLAPAFTCDGWDDGLFALWAGIACHHGKPMEGASETGDGMLIQGMRSAGRAAAAGFSSEVARLFAPYAPLGTIGKGRAETLSWLIAGLTNLADWIGSNRDVFRYSAPVHSLAEYWPIARKRADAALSASGILPALGAPSPQLSTLFPTITTASSLQQWAQDVELPRGPMLAVIEDVTGSGKTEAALLLAARLMADNHAGGVFFALPTMATANAMFERLGESYRRLFRADAAPSLVLAHGRSGLHPGFTQSILATNEQSNGADGDGRGDASSAQCAAWIADDRRKAFLAHIGVGTIDQGFLCVLPAKHQALRLWGLSDRVLIVDEAHAYDAYMGRELERLLKFHAALGGSAIVLSATLPASQRGALAKAFTRGLGVAPTLPATVTYPLATVVSGRGASATPVATRKDRVRRLPVRAVSPGDEALTYVADVAQRGASVAWIRNAVDDTIEAAEALRAMGFSPVLLHARFAMGDRLDIEEDVLRRLGKSSSVQDRHGLIVVGSQILEASLDYDVDAMVTDLAPVDLIIQRAGRLWRHDRQAHGRPIQAPELVVVTPDWRTVDDRNWYRQVSPRAAAVYKHHGAVWRSAKVLSEGSAIETPGGVRALIEAVYERVDNEDVPEPLRKASNDAVGDYNAQKGIANSNLLDVQRGYAGNNTLWTADTVTPTRLGDPVTVFRLGCIENGMVVPWCIADDRDDRRSWALSEVSLSRRKAVGVPKHDAATGAMIETAKASWSAWERDQPLLLLDGGPEGATGAILDASGKPQPVVYGRRTTGLRIMSRS